MTPPREWRYCENCGDRLDDEKVAKNPNMRFCGKPKRCWIEYRSAHPDEYRAQREATATANRRRWQEYHATGADPLHGGEAAKKRGAAIAESNRAKPRRKKHK